MMQKKNQQKQFYYAKVRSVALIGTSFVSVDVECHQSFALPSLQIIGLPKKSVQEAKERVRSALESAGFKLPSRKIVINMTPAWLQKDGSAYDLAIAVACVLASSPQKTRNIQKICFLGELTLDGKIKSFPHAYALSQILRERLFDSLILPYSLSYILKEQHLEHGGGFQSLSDVLKFLNDPRQKGVKVDRPIRRQQKTNNLSSFVQIQGQEAAKRMLTIAAAGGHHFLLYGPRGCGKTLLASSFFELLPPLSSDEIQEIELLYANLNKRWSGNRPVRSPHFSVSTAALIGGGNNCSAGELSLAHLGILFLDELTEFSQKILENLRSPLDSGYIHLSRSNFQFCLPAKIQLVSTANPCPCGLRGDPMHQCLCTPQKIKNYQNRVSAALLDRIEMQMYIRVERENISYSSASQHKLQDYRDKICAARQKMLKRQGYCNAHLKGLDVFQLGSWTEIARKSLEKSIEQEMLSKRSFVNIAKLALTISDVEQANKIEEKHVLEAMQYGRKQFHNNS